MIIDIGRPHAWTLEEARYLLERNRQRDLGLQEKDPSPLDPNDTVGVRANAFRTLLSGSVQFDQSVGAKNRAASTQYAKDIARYNSLRNQLTGLIAKQANVTTQLSAAQAQLTALNNTNPQNTAEIAAQTNLVNQLTADNATLTTEISTIQTATATEPALNVSTSIPSDETTQSALGDDPAFDAMLKGFAPGAGTSKLAASIQLDNYINMQYEMVAKQLTLLRDQAGPTSRVLIVELPHSIYSTSKLHLWPDFGTMWGNFIVQSWWKIDATISCQPIDPNPRDLPPPYRCPDSEELLQLQRGFNTYRDAGDAMLPGTESHKANADDAKAIANAAKANADDANAIANEAQANADDANAIADKALAIADEALAKAKRAKANGEVKANADRAKAKADEAKTNADRAQARADEAKANADRAQAIADKAKAEMALVVFPSSSATALGL